METAKSFAKLSCWAFILSSCLILMRPSEPEYQPNEIEMTSTRYIQKGGVKVLVHLIAHLHSEL